MGLAPAGRSASAFFNAAKASRPEANLSPAVVAHHLARGTCPSTGPDIKIPPPSGCDVESPTQTLIGLAHRQPLDPVAGTLGRYRWELVVHGLLPPVWGAATSGPCVCSTSRNRSRPKINPRPNQHLFNIKCSLRGASRRAVLFFPQAPGRPPDRPPLRRCWGRSCAGRNSSACGSPIAGGRSKRRYHPQNTSLNASAAA